MSRTDGSGPARPETLARLDDVLARIANGTLPVPRGMRRRGPLATVATGSRIAALSAIRLIQRAVADDFRIPVELLTSGCRTDDIVAARQLAMYLARHLTKASFPRIGRAFGRDHATVLHACRCVEASLQIDPRLATAVAGFIERFQAEHGTVLMDGAHAISLSAMRRPAGAGFGGQAAQGPVPQTRL